MRRAADYLALLASLMGACGVALAAASTHAGGGDLGRTASEFLILHAAALIGVAANARSATSPQATRLIIVGGALALGTLLFAADLSSRAFAGGKLFPFAAPLGGSLMILAWIALAVVYAIP
jgi:uncharacterized membrane protein YgdD (TMEM256/DUF423 family)